MIKSAPIHLLLIVLLVSCKNQKSPNLSFEGDTIQTINSKFFTSVINQDSIKILRFDTATIDLILEETLHYIDLKTNNLDKNRLQKMTLNEIKSRAFKYMHEIERLPIDSLINPFSELFGIYVRVNLINDDYFIYNNRMDYFFCITDSLFVSRSQEGYEGYTYAGTSKENNNYILEIFDKPHNRKFEIKPLHDQYNASVWREVFYIFDSNPDTTYHLLVPVQHIKKIPVLYTLYSAGFDDSFDKFDNISPENKFNR